MQVYDNFCLTPHKSWFHLQMNTYLFLTYVPWWSGLFRKLVSFMIMRVQILKRFWLYFTNYLKPSACWNTTVQKTYQNHFIILHHEWTSWLKFKTICMKEFTMVNYIILQIGNTITYNSLMAKRYAYNSKPNKAVLNLNSDLYINTRRNVLKSDIFKTKPFKRLIESQATEQVHVLSAFASTSRIQCKRSHSQTANTLLLLCKPLVYVPSA